MLVCKMYIELFCNNYTDWHCFLFVQVSYYVLIYAPHAPVLLKWPFLGSCVWHLRCTSTGHVYLHFVAHTNMYLFHYTLYIAIYIWYMYIYIDILLYMTCIFTISFILFTCFTSFNMFLRDAYHHAVHHFDPRSPPQKPGKSLPGHGHEPANLKPPKGPPLQGYRIACESWKSQPISGWWFQIFLYFHPYLGKIPILTNIFQRGWNHQLDLLREYRPGGGNSNICHFSS